MKMTDSKIAGKKVYPFPAYTEFLRHFPIMGEPTTLFEETRRSDKVEEV
jgi:hypothetical protein